MSTNASSSRYASANPTIALPPAGTAIPTPPSDYAPAIPGEFRTVVPRQAELAALPQALVDLSSFADFDRTLGSTAPAYAEVEQALAAGAAWTAMGHATSRWAGYVSLMEGLAWHLIRVQMSSVRPAFTLAARRNPKLLEQYRGLATFLAVPVANAQQGAATKLANKNAVAEGKAPTHGKVGKKRKRAAEKAALAASRK